jgi:hypothetical protein
VADRWLAQGTASLVARRRAAIVRALRNAFWGNLVHRRACR